MDSRRIGCCLSCLALALLSAAGAAGERPPLPGGGLRIIGEVGSCPLEHTDVQAHISGFVARVRVTQTFYNPLDERIEAVYVFPLPHKAAVDHMTMTVGERRITGMIRRRAEARAIYREALTRGWTASLLEQERPNVFTQSVGNIEPREEVRIEISYVDVLEYDMGTYEFHFPMVVGPRYIPGRPTSTVPPVPPELKGKVHEPDGGGARPGMSAPAGAGWSPDTDRVPDASRITPPVAKPGLRAGNTISLSVTLDAGVPIRGLRALNHRVELTRTAESEARVTLSPADSIPNKDFVLRYDVAGKKPEMAVLCHTDESGQGHFMLMVQPEEDERLKQSPPRELCFLIDVSGSMSGAPTAKVREALKKFLNLCKKEDTVQVITFAGRASKLFERALPATPGNIERAVAFTRRILGGGGTEMLKGIKTAINDPLDADRDRIVVMLTDGYIGNEAEIIAEVGGRCGEGIRFWCIGIGSAPNRFLLDGVARQGGGMSKVLGWNDEAGPLVQEVMSRIHRAQLANVNVEWGELTVWDTYPAVIPDLWAGRPITVFGRYGEEGGQATVNVTGEMEGEPASWPLVVDFPADEPENDVLAKVWARHKIEDLMHQGYRGGSPEIEEEVTRIALSYGLMTRHTSFVAVEERTVTEGGKPKKIAVPVEMPEGVSHAGVFGGERRIVRRDCARARPRFNNPKEVPAQQAIKRPAIAHEKVKVSDHFETDNDMDRRSARGGEDGISDIPVGGAGVVAYFGVGGGGAGCFGYRYGGGRRKCVARFGGSSATESTVEAALRWLAKHQEPDGRWDAEKHGGEDTDPAVTGLATLAFLGAGYTQSVGKYKTTVWKAMNWIISQQDAEGCIGRGFDGGLGYHHAICGLALAENYGMTRAERVGEAAQKAVEWSIMKHQCEYSGWGPEAKRGPDTSVTGWFVMQLKSAKVAGLDVDGAGFQGAINWLDKVTTRPGMRDPEGGRVSRRQGEEPRVAMTAVGMLCRQFMGWDRTDPLLRGGAEHLRTGLPRWDEPDFRYWSCGTLVMFQMGGEHWKEWNAALKGVLVPHQRKGGDEDGSWDPVGRWRVRGGRVASTALGALCLEVYYRYLPIYK